MKLKFKKQLRVLIARRGSSPTNPVSIKPLVACLDLVRQPLQWHTHGKLTLWNKSPRSNWKLYIYIYKLSQVLLLLLQHPTTPLLVHLNPMRKFCKLYVFFSSYFLLLQAVGAAGVCFNCSNTADRQHLVADLRIV